MGREELKDRDRASEVETHLLICVFSLVASKGLSRYAPLNLFNWFLFLFSYKKFRGGLLEISLRGMEGLEKSPDASGELQVADVLRAITEPVPRHGARGRYRLSDEIKSKSL